MCGEDVGFRCSQGHASGADERFCETCGEFLPVTGSGEAVAVAAAVPGLEYSSGSFTDFIAGGEDDYASLAAPALPEPVPRRREPGPVAFAPRPVEPTATSASPPMIIRWTRRWWKRCFASRPPTWG